MKSQWMLISGLLFALLVAIFAVINVGAVEVNYLFGSTRTPLILVIMFSTLLGGLAVGFIGMFRFFTLQRKVRHLQKQLQELKNKYEPNTGSESELVEQYSDELEQDQHLSEGDFKGNEVK